MGLVIHLEISMEFVIFQVRCMVPQQESISLLEF
jgi:hypothetical protein